MIISPSIQKCSTFMKHFSSWANGEMMAWSVNGFGGLRDVALLPKKLPIVKDKDAVLVKVAAASVNPLDIAVMGGYGNKVFSFMKSIDKVRFGELECTQAKFPLTVGRDFSGEVVSKGQSVKGLSVGDKVYGVISPQTQGSHAQYVIASSSNVAKIPNGITEVDAASLPYVALTGWSAAVISGGMRPFEGFGKKILIIGASGGVGSFLTQLLSAWGTEVTAVCSSSAFDFVHSLGPVVAVFDYKEPETFSELTSNQRFDMILDASGQNDVRWAKGLKPWVGASYVTLLSPLLRNIEEDGLLLGSAKSLGEMIQKNMDTISEGKIYKWAYYMPNSFALREVSKMVAEKKIRPVMDKVFNYKEGLDAYKHVIEGPTRGKTVIDFSSAS